MTQGKFTAAAPESIDELLALIARDLPDFYVELMQCHRSCKYGKWVGKLSREDTSTPTVLVLTEHGMAESTPMHEWGAHGQTPAEALRNVYVAVQETTNG